MSDDTKRIRQLLDGDLPWAQVHGLISGHKDPRRFEIVRSLLQEQVAWDEQIVLPLTAKLYIVDAGTRGLVKCECGHVFGDWRQNWKLGAQVRVRRTKADLQEIFGPLACDPDWMEVREFICPGCAALLEVETAVPGYPFLHDFHPDLEAFYGDWLGQPVPGWARSTER